jgi:hypothetical protein
MESFVPSLGPPPPPDSYPLGTVGFLRRINRQEREADHSPPNSDEAKKISIYARNPSYVFIE